MRYCVLKCNTKNNTYHFVICQVLKLSTYICYKGPFLHYSCPSSWKCLIHQCTNFFRQSFFFPFWHMFVNFVYSPHTTQSLFPTLIFSKWEKHNTDQIHSSVFIQIPITNKNTLCNNNSITFKCIYIFLKHMHAQQSFEVQC